MMKDSRHQLKDHPKSIGAGAIGRSAVKRAVKDDETRYGMVAFNFVVETVEDALNPRCRNREDRPSPIFASQGRGAIKHTIVNFEASLRLITVFAVNLEGVEDVLVSRTANRKDRPK